MKTLQLNITVVQAICLMLLLTALSACAQSAPQAPLATTTPPAEPHIQAAQPSPTAQTSQTEAATPPTAPITQPPPGTQNVAEAAQQILSQQMGADLAAVGVLSVEPVNWRDACLGVAKAGMMCAQVITPGYRITLELDGRQYIYHTDASGSQIVLAETPAPQAAGEVITWTQEDQGACNKLVISDSALMFGSCEGSLQESPDIFKQLRDDLTAYASKYAPFSADTSAGKVQFNGRGTTPASPAEQRMVAEWSRLAFQIAQSGRTGAAWGLALDWRRDGGIANFCDEVTVYLTGFASASSCKGPAVVNLGRMQLSTEQLSHIYAWVDALASFDYENTDPATTDAMQILMTFSGSGPEQASPQDIQDMQDLALDILNQLKFAPDPMRTLAARKSLEAYFAAVRDGRYADAAALYGGDVQVLAGWNPDLEPGDLPALFERGCTTNGLVCNLSIAGYVEEARISPTDYRFTVELSNPDGSPFSRGPCCGADPQTNPPETRFDFTVREMNGEYKVLDLPVYVP